MLLQRARTFYSDLLAFGSRVVVRMFLDSSETFLHVIVIRFRRRKFKCVQVLSTLSFPGAHCLVRKALVLKQNNFRFVTSEVLLSRHTLHNDHPIQQTLRIIFSHTGELLDTYVERRRRVRGAKVDGEGYQSESVL